MAFGAYLKQKKKEKKRIALGIAYMASFFFFFPKELNLLG